MATRATTRLVAKQSIPNFEAFLLFINIASLSGSIPAILPLREEYFPPYSEVSNCQAGYIKRAGWIKKAGWIFIKKKLCKQCEISHKKTLLAILGL